MAYYRHYICNIRVAIITIASIVNIADVNIVIITSLISISIDICRYRNSFVLYTVQLKCNLMPACRLLGGKVQANLQWVWVRAWVPVMFLNNPAGTYGTNTHHYTSYQCCIIYSQQSSESSRLNYYRLQYYLCVTRSFNY